MSFLRRTLRSARGLLGASLVLAPAAQAQDRVPPETEAPLSDADDGFPGERAVFAHYGDLDADETLARLEALTGRDDDAERFFAFASLLARDDVSAFALERQLYVFLAGLDEAQADATLAAFMRDYYDSRLADDLADGVLGLPEVFAALEERADVLVTAAYGSVDARDRGTPRARSIRHLKRRI